MAIVVFGVGQLIIPAVARSVVRGRVDRYGRVLSVSVSAVPAIELAFGDADRVSVHMASYRASEATMASQLRQAAGVSNLDVRIDRVSSGLFSASDARLTKRGSRLVGTGSITEASLRGAIPGLESVRLLASQGGTLTFAGTTALTGAIPFTVSPSDGRIVVSGTGFLSALGVVVWSDPRVRVTSLSGHATAAGFSITATAQMH